MALLDDYNCDLSIDFDFNFEILSKMNFIILEISAIIKFQILQILI